MGLNLQKDIKDNKASFEDYYYFWVNGITNGEKKTTPNKDSQLDPKKKNQLEQANDALRKIREGDESVLKEIYHLHRKEFLAWAVRGYHVGREDAADIFQDAVIIFYKNVLSGKLEQLSASLKTYLFAIGKNRLLKFGEKRKRTVLEEEAPSGWAEKLEDPLQYGIELSHRQQFIQDALLQLTEACRKILTLFYYYRFSMESIKERMGFSSEEGARTAKHRCLKKLAAIIRENEQGLI